MPSSVCQLKSSQESGRVPSHAPDVWIPKRSAPVFSQSNTCPSEGVFDCTLPAKSRDRAATALAKSTAFCERLRCRTHPAWCDGTVHRCRWSAETWLEFGCDRY